MNEKIREQIERAKTQTIGVEVEMNNITRNKAAKIAAEFFGTGRYENTADRNGYCTWSAWDTEGREWKFQKDVSIAGPDDKKCELVTPILHYSDIETLQELIRKLRHAGAVSNAQVGAGVHIHIGANGHTPQTLRNLANIMASHEELIAEALKLDRTRISRYCRTVDPNFLEQLNNKKTENNVSLGRHLVQVTRRKLRQKRTLQRQPIQNAELPFSIHKGNGRVQTFPIRQPHSRTQRRTSCRTA